jgi:hypothetical protein
MVEEPDESASVGYQALLNEVSASGGKSTSGVPRCVRSSVEGRPPESELLVLGN